MLTDWKEFFESLNSKNVKFLIVGAHALAIYGRPRYTEDLDVFVARDEDNKWRLRAALQEFGLPVPDEILNELFTGSQQMIVFGRPPSAIDLLVSLSGVDFDDAWQNRSELELDGVTVQVISRNDYVKTKRASGRAKDLLDLELLREVESGSEADPNRVE